MIFIVAVVGLLIEFNSKNGIQKNAIPEEFKEKELAYLSREQDRHFVFQLKSECFKLSLSTIYCDYISFFPTESSITDTFDVNYQYFVIVPTEDPITIQFHTDKNADMFVNENDDLFSTDEDLEAINKISVQVGEYLLFESFNCPFSVKLDNDEQAPLLLKFKKEQRKRRASLAY